MSDTKDKRIAELEGQIAAAKEDTARLDWLIDHAMVICGHPKRIKHGLKPFVVADIAAAPSDFVVADGNTPREAIDAARKERA